MAPAKKYSLYLINPKRKYRYHYDFKELCDIMGKKTSVLPLALPTVAALTPDHYTITIMDEEMYPIRFEPLPDLVGLTALGSNIKRAYAIADRFRSLGVTVVMGGPQVSFNVEDALQHADAVVIGEAEGIWEECLRDFENRQLKSTYQRSDFYEFKTQPIPRWDLVETGKIMALGVQASRGCPFSCEFCLVRNMVGRRHRYRDIGNLIQELESLPKKQITFTDDNLTADKEYARELMRRLKPLKISWMCQSSLEICEDDELLDAMSEAGCTQILLGIESLNPESLKETGKFQNRVERYERGIRRIHSHGIHVIGSFIIGFDSDRLDAFDRIYDFTMRNSISLIMLNVLTAYPGTNLYARMLREGRICCIDPDLLNGIYPTMRFNHMSQQEVFAKYFETLEKMFSYDTVLKKAEKTLGSGAFTRYNEADISVRDKLNSIFHLIRRYVLTIDQSRRRFFTRLLALVFQQKASVGNVIEFMLVISSFNGYLEFISKHRAEIVEIIKQNDPGPLTP